VLQQQLLLERGFITRIAYITHDLPMLSISPTGSR
jgi:hypothetical protein